MQCGSFKTLPGEPLPPNAAYADIGGMTHECPYCHAMMWAGEATNSHNGTPAYGLCCKLGRVELEPLPLPPPELQELLTSDNRDAKHFRDNLRKYNNAFAMVSAAIHHESLPGISAFRISGNIVHRMGQLRPDNNSNPANVSLSNFALPLY